MSRKVSEEVNRNERISDIFFPIKLRFEFICHSVTGMREVLRLKNLKEI